MEETIVQAQLEPPAPVRRAWWFLPLMLIAPLAAWGLQYFIVVMIGREKWPAAVLCGGLAMLAAFFPMLCAVPRSRLRTMMTVVGLLPMLAAGYTWCVVALILFFANLLGFIGVLPALLIVLVISWYVLHGCLYSVDPGLRDKIRRVVLGYAVLVPLVLFFMMPTDIFTRHRAPDVRCGERLHDIGSEILYYALGTPGLLPPANLVWSNTIAGTRQYCPNAAMHHPIDYGYNALVAGKPLLGIQHPETLVLMADGGNAQHLLTGMQDIDRTRHRKITRETFWNTEWVPAYWVLYADGHTELVPADMPVRLQP